MVTAAGCGNEVSGHDEGRVSASTAVRAAMPGDPAWYFDSARSILVDANVDGGWAHSPRDVLPGGSYTDLVVVGTIVDVAPGRGYVYRDDQAVADNRGSVDFDDPDVDARDLVATLEVEEAWGPRGDTDPVGPAVTLRFGGPPSWDAATYASSLLGMGRAVFFLVHRAAPDQSDYGVVGPGPLIGLVEGDRLTFPGVRQPGLGVDSNFMAPYGTLDGLRGLLRSVKAAKVAG